MKNISFQMQGPNKNFKTKLQKAPIKKEKEKGKNGNVIEMPSA